MVLKLSNLGSEDEPVFIPRKKRKASIAQEIKNGKLAFDPVKDSIASAPPVSLPGVRLPTWRIEKEESLRPLDNTPIKSLKWTEKTRLEMTQRDWRLMRNDLQLKCSTPIQPLLDWSELNNKSLANLMSKTYPTPTPVQRAAIRVVCQGDKNLVAVAPTGSGKTIGFAVPIIEMNVKQALILAPTRELAVQTAEVIESLEQLQVVALVGGHDFESQLAKLEQNSNARLVIVATPGRLLDFIDQQLIDLKGCDYLVFDEADRMIDMGFEPQISSIMAHLKESQLRRTLMFSATWPEGMQVLSLKFLSADYIKIEVEQNNPSTPQIGQVVELFESEPHKLERLLQCVKQARPPVICFVATKVNAERVSTQLNARGVSSQYLHGGLSQAARDSTVGALRHRTIKCLVATDIASRGVDIPGVSLVVNYDLPTSIEIYVHRIGRTGRAGQRGNAVSFAMKADTYLFPSLRNQLRKSGCPVPNFLRASS